jgi:membrane-bound serine protease (ClpP class)
MSVVLLLFAVGVVLLAMDIFAASFLLAAVGGAVMLAGCAVAYDRFGLLGAGSAGLVAAALLAFTIYFELTILPQTRFGRGLIVHATSGAAQPPLAARAAVVGQDATALTTLAPSGYVEVAGQRYEAFCQTGHAPLGATLRVTGLDNFRLIVSQL